MAVKYSRWRRSDEFYTECKNVHQARENFLNAIVQQAYVDLVHMNIMEKRYSDSVHRLEDWFRNVLPTWIYIDPEEMIYRAKKEAEHVAKGIPEDSDAIP